MNLSNFFKDNHGRIVILQWPNIPLWIAIICFFLHMVPLPFIRTISYWGMTVALLYWSYLEIISGVSPFRRFLGVIIGLGQIIKILT